MCPRKCPVLVGHDLYGKGLFGGAFMTTVCSHNGHVHRKIKLRVKFAKVAFLMVLGSYLCTQAYNH